MPCPSIGSMSLLTRRASWSAPPPGPQGTISSIGRSGYPAATALPPNRAALMANSKIVTLRMVERMDSSLPIGRLLACPARGPARQECWSGLCLPLIAQGREFHPDEVSFHETCVLNTLTEGLGPARVNPRRAVSPSENLFPAGSSWGFVGRP